MASLTELVQYCDALLDVSAYQDYCPNGLQVEGVGEVRRIVSGVTASQALIDRAVELDADLLLVHHGYFWKGESAPITGIKRRRIKALLENDISLLAYHLPLDGHDSLGNNAQLARLWGIAVEGRFGQGPDGGLGMFGSLQPPLSTAALGERLDELLQREPMIIQGGDQPIRRLGWCSGAAEGYIEAAAAAGLDAFISGEISEPTVHAARELGIHYFSAGHHATERYGVKALGEHLSEYFSLENHFVDIANPV
ncbi:MAG: Nif3-like dinuclear metal center hexameric protein [Gammaproteobacteria bacterium]|nr:Nif3-like dinuclear metal center hexameric protein [Gammaproteobacteria bacterium]